LFGRATAPRPCFTDARLECAGGPGVRPEEVGGFLRSTSHVSRTLVLQAADGMTRAAQASFCCHGESQPAAHGAPCEEPARRASRSPARRKRVAEHRPAALGLLPGRLVLDDVPVLDEDPVLEPEDV